MKNILIKRTVSFAVLISLLVPSIGYTGEVKYMDICNYTHGDTSGDYYDGLCTKDGKKAETEDTKVEEPIVVKKEEKDIVVVEDEYKFKHKLGSTNLKIYHTPFWLSPKTRSKTKDEQLCKVGSVFKYIDVLGKEVTYLPEGCQKEEVEDITEEVKTSSGDVIDDDTMDELFGDIFGDELEEDTSTGKTEVKTSTGDTKEEDDSIGDEELDELFGDLFSLSGKKLVPTIREFVNNKLKIKVGNISANFIRGENNYNESMAFLLNNVNKTFKIDSIKNDFARNISNVSYSFSTYKNTTDIETKRIFKKKLERDISKLKKKYKKLQFKDMIVSRAIAARS